MAAANKDYQLALKALDDRAKYLPEIPATYFLRATTFDNLKAIPQAVEYYQRFLAADAGKFPDQEWQARHRLIALDPKHADKYRSQEVACAPRFDVGDGFRARRPGVAGDESNPATEGPG